MAQRAVQGTSGQERELALQEADRTLRFERRAASRCALCLTVSEPEAAAARTLLDIDHVQVVPNGVDTSLFVPGEAPPTRGYLLFTGRMDAAPNIEAVQSFVKNVLPLIHRQVPEACLHVVGANPEKEVLRLASDRVVVHGRTADLSRYYREAAVVVVPLLHGGGTHQKVLEAAASGKAIVSSPLGAEGLGFSPGEDLLVADSAANFAGAVVRLLRDERQRRRLGARARQACRQYDWGKVGAHFCRLLENLIKPRAFALRGPTPGYREKPAGGREGLEALNRER